jgi:hypothetical protein
MDLRLTLLDTSTDVSALDDFGEVDDEFSGWLNPQGAMDCHPVQVHQSDLHHPYKLNQQQRHQKEIGLRHDPLNADRMQLEPGVEVAGFPIYEHSASQSGVHMLSDVRSRRDLNRAHGRIKHAKNSAKQQRGNPSGDIFGHESTAFSLRGPCSVGRAPLLSVTDDSTRQLSTDDSTRQLSTDDSTRQLSTVSLPRPPLHPSCSILPNELPAGSPSLLRSHDDGTLRYNDDYTEFDFDDFGDYPTSNEPSQPPSIVDDTTMTSGSNFRNGEVFSADVYLRVGGDNEEAARVVLLSGSFENEMSGGIVKRCCDSRYLLATARGAIVIQLEDVFKWDDQASWVTSEKDLRTLEGEHPKVFAIIGRFKMPPRKTFYLVVVPGRDISFCNVQVLQNIWVDHSADKETTQRRNSYKRINDRCGSKMNLSYACVKQSFKGHPRPIEVDLFHSAVLFVVDGTSDTGTKMILQQLWDKAWGFELKNDVEKFQRIKLDVYTNFDAGWIQRSLADSVSTGRYNSVRTSKNQRRKDTRRNDAVRPIIQMNDEVVGTSKFSFEGKFGLEKVLIVTNAFSKKLSPEVIVAGFEKVHNAAITNRETQSDLIGALASKLFQDLSFRMSPPAILHHSLIDGLNSACIDIDQVLQYLNFLQPGDRHYSAVHQFSLSFRHLPK